MPNCWATSTFETFPTIVACSAAGVHFAGPLEPQGGTLRRVLLAALEDGAAPASVTPEAQAFARRLIAGG